MFHPLYLHVDWAVGGVEVSDEVGVSAVVQSDRESSVQSVRDSLQAASVALRNAASFQAMSQGRRPRASAAPGGHAELYTKMLDAADKLLASAEWKVEGSQVLVSMKSPLSTKELGALAVAAAPAVQRSRQAAKQMQGLNNLKQLALGMLNYESVHRRFPAAESHAIPSKAERSKYPHSWRVTILPYLEEQTMYEQYRFDEPWDSEANKKVLARMPAVFRSPHDPDPNSTNTSYFVFTGPGTLFEGEPGTQLKRVTDGLSRTLLIVEAKRSVPWTKPDDIEYAEDQPLPKLGGWIPGEFAVAFADGSVHRVSTDVDDETLRPYITKGDGKVSPELPPPGGQR
jgi:hypothetical protein